MLSAFCERLYWSDYSILFQRINEKINWCVKEELLELMRLPSLKPERARALFLMGITTVSDLAKETVDYVVKCFCKQEGFQSHAAKNTDDLKLKYDYLYSLSHSILQEAKMLEASQALRVDDTQDLPSLAPTKLKHGKKVHSEFMLDSEGSQSDKEIESSVSEADLDLLEYNLDNLS